MSSFICRQPNGLLCRFSTVVDCPTHYNMTEEDYIENEVQALRSNLMFNFEIGSIFKDFAFIGEYFSPNNMSEIEFKKLLKKMEEPVTEKTKTNIST